MSKRPSVEGTTVHCAACTAPIFRVSADGTTLEFKCPRPGCGEWHQVRSVIGFVRGSYGVPDGHVGQPRAPAPPPIDITPRDDVPNRMPRGPVRPPSYPPDE